jgi:hypothetical protein
MSSRKYVGPTIICRLETGENMSAQKKNFGGAAPLHPPSYPPARPAQALRHYYSCKEYNTYPTVMVLNKESTWHMCPNFMALNKLKIKNKCPISIIDDLLDELHG